MHFAYLIQPQISRQNTVTVISMPGEHTWTAVMRLAWVWAWALHLQHLGAEFLVGQSGRINVIEMLGVQQDQT